MSSASDAVKKVFVEYSWDHERLFQADLRRNAARPLQRSTFAPLRGYFSERQQLNVNRFLDILDALIGKRAALAHAWGIREGWWWPQGIDELSLDPILKRDLLTNRMSKPKRVNVSPPLLKEGKLVVTVNELFDQPYQDGGSERGRLMSSVFLVPERSAWVIDEISSVIEMRGTRQQETLTERLQDSIKPLRLAKARLDEVPARPQTKKAVKAMNR